MKNILVPTDFSKNAYAALYYTVKLFSDESIQFYILHSFSDRVSALTSRIDIGKSEKLIDELYDEVDKQGEKLIHQINLDTDNKHTSFEMISTSMSLAKAINKLVVEKGIDLVAMGTKGQTAIEDIFLGSNTVEVIKKIKNAPLLIVPKELDFVIPSEIAFSTDFNEVFPTAGLVPIMSLVKRYQSTLHLLYVGEKSSLNDQQNQHVSIIKKTLKDCNVKTHWVKKEKSVAASINSFVINEGIDILAMVYHKHNIIVQFFREPIVKSIGKTTSTPYLIIPVSN